MILIFSTIGPVLLLIALGKFLCEKRFFGGDFFRDINRLTYYIALPAYLFDMTAKARFDARAFGTMSGLMLLLCVLLLVISFTLTWLARFDAARRATFVQAVFRGNIAYAGIPVVNFAFQEQGWSKDLNYAIVGIAPAIIIFNLLAIFVMLPAANTLKTSSGTSDETVLHKPSPPLRKLMLQVFSNPLIIACISGLFFGFYQLQLPAVVDRAVMAVAQMSMPLALLALGASLDFQCLRREWRPALVAALLKTLLTPILMILLCRFFALPPMPTLALAIYAACPTAVSSHVLAQQMGGDLRLSAATIVMGTCLCIPALAFFIWYLNLG